MSERETQDRVAGEEANAEGTVEPQAEAAESREEAAVKSQEEE